ncbi:DUF2007 domain-containing protein [Marinifilum sp. D714]|uniref:putative signal transducing protein n=1 Tax=Marinifilum sp. D714 TaxID=2937523 RepID=UPI0027BFD4E7|nr:DUF2007 domain-containing protein [Marinifilum sp. D714]MDQ2177301.1 DUF2007 domain-containing protein [Marinifilum sp. D714]
MKTKRLMTCESPIEANIIKGRLENEGIRCFVTNENFSNLMPHYNRILGSGAELMIDQDDYKKAVEILELNSRKEIVCPNCNSKNIKMSLGKNWFKKAVVIVISLFSSVPFNNINSTYMCKDCNIEFKNR